MADATKNKDKLQNEGLDIAETMKTKSLDLNIMESSKGEGAEEAAPLNADGTSTDKQTKPIEDQEDMMETDDSISADSPLQSKNIEKSPEITENPETPCEDEYSQSSPNSTPCEASPAAQSADIEDDNSKSSVKTLSSNGENPVHQAGNEAENCIETEEDNKMDTNVNELTVSEILDTPEESQSSNDSAEQQATVKVDELENSEVKTQDETKSEKEETVPDIESAMETEDVASVGEDDDSQSCAPKGDNSDVVAHGVTEVNSKTESTELQIEDMTTTKDTGNESATSDKPEDNDNSEKSEGKTEIPDDGATDSQSMDGEKIQEQTADVKSSEETTSAAEDIAEISKTDADGIEKMDMEETDATGESKDKETESGDKETESGDKETESGDKETESGDKETESGDKETESGDKETESGDKETESGDKETESGDKETESGDKDKETESSVLKDKETESDPDVSIIEEEKVEKEKEIVNLIDDEDEDDLKKTSKPSEAIVHSSNDMGLQISSVTSGATMPADDKPAPTKPTGKSDSKSSKQKTPQICIVCSKVCKCKYNIVRNGDIKHLCDDNCFKKFRSNPTQYLKSAKQPEPAPAEKTVSNGSSGSNAKTKPTIKTCHVCQLMNISTNKPFCNWHGLDFCDEACLQKFQNNLNTSCSLCTEVIPVSNRGLYVFKISVTDIRTLCTQKCLTEFRKLIRLCTYCNKDLSNCPDSFSAPVGSQKTFHEFCTQDCMSKYEKEMNAPEVEITSVMPGSVITPAPCAVCNKSTIPLHTVKLNNITSKLCGAPCLQAFQYANKLTLNKCENCGKVCSSEETKSFFIQYEGNQKKFCSDRCVETFRNANQKVVPCAWCGAKKRNFDMIERVDSNNKYQLFCTLNCLSLYRVNLQAKSNLCVPCDHCRKYTPAQYHLTMSDASVRNFCSYNCVMSFQRQFTSGSTSTITPNSSVKPTNKSTTRSTQAKQQAAPPSVPIISNVVSLAPPSGQRQQTVNIKNTNQVPVVIGGQKGTTTPTTSTGTQPIQQQIIVQPPAPKVMKNKSLLCKPFVQTKATSCRPSTQHKKCGTDDDLETKPVLIPVPIPVYVPTPLAMYANPTPIFFPVPIPIPVPIFIPTTKKSASKILKQIKEIQTKIPADPLEAELLMMAEAVAGDKGSSDSESESDKGEDLTPFVEELEEKSPIVNKGKEGEEDMLQMALRVAEEISEPIMDLEDNVEPVAVKTEPPPKTTHQYTPDDDDPVYSPPIPIRPKRGAKRTSRGRTASSRSKRQRYDEPEVDRTPPPQAMLTPAQPPEDANSYLKFTYGVNAWKHWVVYKNSQLDKVSKAGSVKLLKLFKTDLLQCTADELNYSLCLFCKEVRKPNGEEYSPDSIYYLCLGIQQYLYENGRVDNIFSDFYYEKFAECLSEVLATHQPKLNSAGQMLCRIEEEHLWEAKQLGAHSPYVLLNTLIYFHTKYFMMKTPQEHMNMSFTQILKHWRKGGPGKPSTANNAGRSVTLRYYCMGPGGAPGKPKSKEGIPVYETSENLENPLRCPVKLYEFYLSKCPESIKNVNDMFYLVPERSCVPDSPVWYSTQSLAIELMTKMLNRILLVREIQEAHLHAQPIYV